MNHSLRQRKTSFKGIFQRIVELLFEQPYCKVKFIVEKGIAKRQTAVEYLYELEK